jgi:very-short-patch-repair endonuclease
VNLVIELDGESHEGRQSYDNKRAQFLTKLGLKIFRITNDNVIDNLEGVAIAILRECGIAPDEPTPNPNQKGRGI